MLLNELLAKKSSGIQDEFGEREDAGIKLYFQTWTRLGSNGVELLICP